MPFVTKTYGEPVFDAELTRRRRAGRKVSKSGHIAKAQRHVDEAAFIGWPGLQRSWERSLELALEMGSMHGVTR